MARAVKLTVLNPAATLLDVQEATWVHLRLADGTGLTIYPGHAPLLAETVTAPLRYADEAGEHVFNAKAGVLQVEDDAVTVFTSGESEAKSLPKTSAVSQERRFERLARKLRAKLEDGPESGLGDLLSVSYE